MSDAPTPAPTPPSPPALTDDQTSGRMFVRWNAVTLVLGIVALLLGWLATRAQGAEGPAPFDAGWDDGKAEVARYEAVRTIYGQPRPYELVRIVVKEPYDPRQGVKPDADREGVVDAFKVVAVHEVPTGKPYEYRQTTFVHLDRADPRRALQASMGSQEWCGNTFVRLVRDASGLRRFAHSYWDGQADWDDALPAGVWLEDQLPLTLRALDPAGAPLEVEVLPTLLGNKAPRTAAVKARLQADAKEERVTTPAGAFECVRWTVDLGERTLRYWVATGAPRRPLVKYEDGTGAATLRSLERDAYWLAR